MRIRASLKNSDDQHHVSLTTNDGSQTLDIPLRPDGRGSGANGGELLFLALAACYCNDIYRDAARLGIEVTGVEVIVEGDFGAPGEPGQHLLHSAADGPDQCG